MNINERIKHLVDLLTKGKQRPFAKSIDIPPSTLNSIIDPARRDPSFSIIIKILKTYPSVNTDWLVKGEGEPLVANKQKEPEKNKELELLYDKVNSSTFISSNLRLLRKHANESQKSFGDTFEITRDNVASYERGSKPNLHMLAKIVNYFHISVVDFISYDLKEHPEILEKISVPNKKDKKKY